MIPLVCAGQIQFEKKLAGWGRSPLLLQSSTNCNAILEASLVFNIPVVSKPYLWHLRLDHVSDNNLNVLQHTLLDVITFHSNKDCILCPVAKQKNVPFPSFNHLFDHAFDLIRYDVWGPFAKPTQEV